MASQSPGSAGSARQAVVLSRQYLLEAVWGLNDTVQTCTLDILLSQLRNLLQLADNGWRIRSVYAHGYRLETLGFAFGTSWLLAESALVLAAPLRSGASDPPETLALTLRPGDTLIDIGERYLERRCITRLPMRGWPRLSPRMANWCCRSSCHRLACWRCVRCRRLPPRHG